ncbi:unnamed protein product [Timema podura]|uniref:Uncharacterized protein n=1 Tax=Timema podura TaxID=61482 RepID=A0ABN7NLR4_TIMPD|nr:unnamed protein product [Timema podura]
MRNLSSSLSTLYEFLSLDARLKYLPQSNKVIQLHIVNFLTYVYVGCRVIGGVGAVPIFTQSIKWRCVRFDGVVEAGKYLVFVVLVACD